MGRAKPPDYGPRAGPTEKLLPPSNGTTNGAEIPQGRGVEVYEPFAGLPDTGRRALESMAPGSPERAAMVDLIRALEKRYSGGGGGGGRDSDPPVPKHLQKTKQVIEFIKYVVVLILGIASLGWLGHSYISGFQTSEVAEAHQDQIERSIDGLAEHVEDNDDAIDSLGLSGVQIMLEQRNTNDRLDQVLQLQRASGGSRTQRRRAEVEVDVIQRRIERRQRVQRDEVRLRSIARDVQDDPLGGLEGL